MHSRFSSIHTIKTILVIGGTACLMVMVFCTPNPRYVTVRDYSSSPEIQPPSQAVPSSVDSVKTIETAKNQAAALPIRQDSVPIALKKNATDTGMLASSWESGFSQAPAPVSRDISKGESEQGVAAWYGPGFERRKTASGERFDTRKLTAAHKTLPFNTTVKVTNLDNGLSVVVRVNDRGPFTRNRIIDLSPAAARIIGLDKTGTANVVIEPIGWQAP